MGKCSDWIVVSPRRASGLALIAGLMIGGITLIGCQTAPPTVSNRTLLAHLPGIDFSGLRSMKFVEPVKADVSLPARWTKLHLDRNPLYANQQWKSPSGYTGVGIVYIHLPMQLSASTLLWFAKLEYSKKNADGQALGQWTDALGRPWFEAENDKYHVRGYAVVNGTDAWIVYSGFKTTRPTNAAEMSLAARCIDTVVPRPSDAPAPSAPAVAETATGKSSTKG